MRTDSYRTEIDGLRGISVAAVLIYHFFPRALPGGFAGVDVFFVISGYLITGIIAHGAPAGFRSLRSFYRRRILRIFPALIVVLLATTFLAWMLSFPSEFRMVGKHVFGGAVFWNNVLVMRETNYFDHTASSKPLLHLWSLAVEEQFYIIWPPLLVVLGLRAPRSVLPVTLLLIVLSGLAAYLIALQSTAAAFYLSIGRFWELLAGAATQLLLARRTEWRAPVYFETLGLAVICGVFLLPDLDEQWPGLFTIAVVAGSAMILSSSTDNHAARRVLTTRALVWLGLVSYPLYLWHWPLLTFKRLIIVDNPLVVRSFAAATCLILSVILAWLTWRFVERPVRARQTFPMALATSMTLGAIGMFGLLMWNASLPIRLDTPLTRRLEAARVDDVSQRFRDREDQVLAPRGQATDTTLLLGDSHMGHYWPRVRRIDSLHLFHGPVVLSSRSGCDLLPKVDRVGKRNCAPYYRAAIARARQSGISTIILTVRWERTFGMMGARAGGRIGGVPLAVGGEATEPVLRQFTLDLRALVSMGKRVVIILPSPSGYDFSPVAQWPGRLTPRPARPLHSLPRDSIYLTIMPIRERILRVARESGAQTVDPFDYFCAPHACSATDAHGDPISRDGDHYRASFVAASATFMDSLLVRAR